MCVFVLSSGELNQNSGDLSLLRDALVEVTGGTAGDL